MRRSVDVHEPQADILLECKRLLGEHGVLAYPTETFYGLAASALDAEACSRVFELKGRPSTKALPCIASDWQQVAALAAEVPEVARALAREFWPGPLTLVFSARASVAAASEDGTVAVRVSSLPLARELARVAGPLTSTSANVSGVPPASTAEAVEDAFGDRVPLILDGGPTDGGLPSTIVDVTTAHPRLVRAGRIRFDAIESVFPS